MSGHDENVEVLYVTVGRDTLYMSRLMTCGDASNCTWTYLAIPTLAVFTLPNTGRNLSNYYNSNYRGLDEEDSTMIVYEYARTHCCDTLTD